MKTRMERTVIAGFGFASHATAEDFARALGEAERVTGRKAGVLAVLAPRAGHEGLETFARQAGLAVVTVDQAAAEAVAPLAVSHSARSMAATGLPSVSECVALAAGRREERSADLVALRVLVGPVSVALADPARERGETP